MLPSILVLLLLLCISIFLWFTRKSKEQYSVGIALAFFATLFAIVLMVCDIWQAGLAVCLGVILCLAYALRRKPLVGWWSRIVGVMSILMLVAAIAPFYFFPIPKLPNPTGQWNIGTQQFEMTDESRNGEIFGKPEMARRLSVRVWYPTDETRGKTRPYLTKAETKTTISAIGESFGIGWGTWYAKYTYRPLRHIKTHAFIDAKISQTEEQFPVLIFSHGLWCWLGQSTALMEKLASHGYIIYSVAHPHDSADIQFVDGSVIKTAPFVGDDAAGYSEDMLAYLKADTHDERYARFDKFKQDFNKHRLLKSYKLWNQDLEFLTQAIADRHTPLTVAAVTAKTDMGRFGLLGMSFGGTNAASVCHNDTRCKAAINLDGEEFDWNLQNTDIRMPFLMMHSDWWKYGFGQVKTSEEFHLNDYAYERWDTTGKRKDVYRIRVKELQHLGFTDLPITLRMPLRDKAYGSQNGAIALNSVNDTVLSFLDVHVKGEAIDFPNNVLQRYPALDKHNPSNVSQWWRERTAEIDQK